MEEEEDTDVEEATGQHLLQATSPVANRDENNVDANMQLESKETLIEEEPWYEVVLSTWPSYLPSV